MPKKTFAAGLVKYRAKDGRKDNHPKWTGAKAQLRQEAMEMIGAPAAVLDCFAGAGEMWRAAWRSAPRYLGTDADLEKVWRHPAPIHHAKAQVALRALDLSGFNVFDLDAYGSPWPEFTVLAARRRLRPGERVAICLTDGSVRRAMLGLTNHALASLAAADPKAPGAHLRWAELARAALEEAARRMGGGRLVALRQSDMAHQSKGIWHGLGVLEGAA